ncbi:MSCRAMM family adhesin SdrC [Streptomyces sp. 891-h]|uniref:MSCRAMM family adhesin SdrC n=1 Tax=Streptomyces sp. 891-h TaxID=2720714 RepID=UPI001FAACB8B|nr:MSCRAMM family adhesin SdrC [Streptomyces sp. 891-h]UNZ17250.1 hypothetical protein HC362_09450 [Streptomyces sp. 891-h]
MPGDQVHEGEGAREHGASGARGRTGPRHAAPRKPLLTRFHLPAGKAIALAAMPSAVLMGVGLTPQLANAKPLPKNPFKGDSCVSISEQQETEKEKQERKERAEKLKEDLAREQAKREKAAEEAARKAAENAKEGADSAKDKATGGTSDEKSGDASPSPSQPSGGSSDAQPSPSPTPSTSSGDSSTGSQDDEENPWYDPLGVGKTLDGVLSPDKDQPSSSPTPSPSSGSGSDSGDGSSSTAPKDGSGGSKSGSSGGSGSADSGSDTKSDSAKKDSASEKDGQDSKSEDDKSGKDGESGKDSEGDKDAADSGVDKNDGTARDFDPDKDAGKPFPCPEKMSVKGKDEQTPAQIPDDPWYLEASSLALMGLDYEGVVNIRKPNGETKQALKFTADAVDIGDLHQLVKADGVTYHVQASKGSTSTIRGGKVTMYTEELKGNLFGLIPVTFTPETPPPLNVPYAYFTDVSVRQAGQFGGTLTVPGLHNSISK